MDVAAYIACRDAHRPRHRDDKVREVLTYARPQLEHVVDAAVDVRHGAVVGELTADRGRELVEGVLDRFG